METDLHCDRGVRRAGSAPRWIAAPPPTATLPWSSPAMIQSCQLWSLFSALRLTRGLLDEPAIVAAHLLAAAGVHVEGEVWISGSVSPRAMACLAQLTMSSVVRSLWPPAHGWRARRTESGRCGRG